MRQPVCRSLPMAMTRSGWPKVGQTQLARWSEKKNRQDKRKKCGRLLPRGRCALRGQR